MKPLELHNLLEDFSLRFFPEDPTTLHKLKLYTSKSPDGSGIEKICKYINEHFDPDKLDPRNITDLNISKWVVSIIAITDLDMMKIPDADRSFQIKAAGLVIRSVAWKIVEMMKEIDASKTHRIITTLNEKLEKERNRHDTWASLLIEEVGLSQLIKAQFGNETAPFLPKKRYLIWIGIPALLDKLAYSLKKEKKRNWIKSQNSFVKAFSEKPDDQSERQAIWLKSVYHLVWLIHKLYRPDEGKKLIKASYGNAIWKAAEACFVDKEVKFFDKDFAQILIGMKRNPERYRLTIREVENLLNNL